MKNRFLALFALALIAAPFAAHAGAHNKEISNNMYMGSYDREADHETYSSGHHEEQISTNSAWEEIAERANKVRNHTDPNPQHKITADYGNGHKNNGKNIGAQNNNKKNSGSNRYLNNPNANYGSTRYNFRYGGYAIQNQINNGQRPNSYGQLSASNFNGNPATYQGAPYQNFRGYNNFAAGGYNLGMYGYGY